MMITHISIKALVGRQDLPIIWLLMNATNSADIRLRG